MVVISKTKFKMSTVGIITDIDIGGNFVAWSLHRLSNSTSYYFAEEQQQTAVCDDPLSNVNSHKFKSNHPNNLEKIEPILQQLDKQPDLQHIYIHQLRNIDNSSLDSNFQTRQGIDLLKKYCKKIIVVSKPQAYNFYDTSIRRRSLITPSNDGTKLIESDQQALEDFLDYFFSDNKKHWPNIEQMTTWDQREFLSLVMRPFEGKQIKNYHSFDFDYFDLSAVDLWLNFDHSVIDVFDYCELGLDQTTFKHWQSVYNKWQQLHRSRLQFCWYFDTIIDNILQGRYMDLQRFNLDIVQEAAIQHVLIYNHNLNLKTWQLEKFINTRQLHSLLEPNIHPLSS